MLSQRKLTICILSCIIFIIGPIQTTHARSLYAIIRHYGAILTAYDIQGDQIDYQTDTQIDTAAVGLALDPDSHTLFVSFDGPAKLQLVDAGTMTTIETITAPLAGGKKIINSGKNPGNYGTVCGFCASL